MFVARSSRAVVYVSGTKVYKIIKEEVRKGKGRGKSCFCVRVCFCFLLVCFFVLFCFFVFLFVFFS